MNDKYPKTITDESSGIEVSNDLYTAYQAGKDDCAKTHFKPDWKIKAQDIKDATEEGFKAGYLECDKKWLPIIDRIRKECLLAGRKEVVEWVRNGAGYPDHTPPVKLSYIFYTIKGIEKLKEWGVLTLVCEEKKQKGEVIDN